MEPTLASLTAAANSMISNMPEDFRISITNSMGKGSYPIGSFTYLLVRQDMSSSEKGAAFVGFLNWAIKEGQKTAGALDYAPLPSSLVKKLEATIRSIKTAK
ncbi:hypothetical protein EBT16_11110 [bacterium]|nr:hypothetical protein [bacterium]